MKNFPNAAEVFTTGIPKSGNTWLDRLLSDMLSAPAQCNHDEPIDYYGIGDYKDDYVVRKLHMPWDPEIQSYHCYSDDIRERCLKGKVVFIHRDPRGVMVSAMHYRNTEDLMGVIKQQTRDYKPQATQNAYEAWANSYLESDKADVVVTYEDLFRNGVPTLERIINAVRRDGDVFTREWLSAVYERQSFDNIKHENTDFYWKGRPDTWRSYFTYDTGKLITEKLGEFMLLHGFETDLDWYKELRK